MGERVTDEALRAMVMGPLIPPVRGPARHRHGLGLPTRSVNDYVVRCTCGRWLTARHSYVSFSGSYPENVANWIPVRWWHRTARRTIRDGA